MPEREVIEDPVSDRFTRLVSRGICLCESGEGIDNHQDIFISALAPVQVQEVNRDKFEWLGGYNAHEWRPCLTARLL